MNIVEVAKKFAQEAHKDQKRKFSGAPYFTHCEAVVKNLEDALWEVHGSDVDNLFKDVIAAAYLHDVIEDCGVNPGELHYIFNAVTVSLVWEVTNRYTKDLFPDMARKERKAKEHERIGQISEFGKLIKLADRLHNIESLISEKPDLKKGDYYFKETKDLMRHLEGVNEHLEYHINDYLEIWG